MPPIKHLYEPTEVWFNIQSATNSSLQSNILKFTYYKGEDPREQTFSGEYLKNLTAIITSFLLLIIHLLESALLII